MRRVLFVFEAVVLEQIGVGEKFLNDAERDRLEGFVPAPALTGYSPSDQPALGFTYAVIDRELGRQTFSVGPELPFVEDPSLWGTLDLKR